MRSFLSEQEIRRLLIDEAGGDIAGPGDFRMGATCVRQNEMSPAIRAIDSALFRHSQKHTWMAKLIIAAIAIKLFGIDSDSFERLKIRH